MKESKPRLQDGSDLDERAGAAEGRQRLELARTVELLQASNFDHERVRSLLRIAFTTGGAARLDAAAVENLQDARGRAKPWAQLLQRWHEDHDVLHELFNAEPGEVNSTGVCSGCENVNDEIVRAHLAYGAVLAAEVNQWEEFLEVESDATRRQAYARPPELRTKGGVISAFEAIGLSHPQIVLMFLACRRSPNERDPDLWPPTEQHLEEVLPFDQDALEDESRRLRSAKHQFAHHGRAPNPARNITGIEGLAFDDRTKK